jgi:serine/threonine protein kinase
MSESPGQSVGPWTLQGPLGKGGNATVWRATRPELEEPVALKLISTTKVEKEPYQRFVREIGFLREHQAVRGVLPLLDAHLPDQPSRADPPWLAMPVAVPIARALDGQPLPHIAAAVAAIADTLARLQRDFNIAHRDIKPGNLYELDGSWLIGDFGLVALPDAEPLTVEGRQVGPAHYTAYEMILNPTTADPHPADVYSLGKTLWVLATDQKWPPEGHQPVGSRGFDVGDFRPHARAGALDREVDLMTQLHPEERPTKEQVARDLAAWGALATEPVPFDVTDARARLRIKLQNEIAQQDTHEQQKEMALAAVRRLQVLTGPLNDGLKNLYERTRIDTQSDTLTRNLLKTQFHHGQDLVFRWQRCTFVAPFEGLTATTLRMSRCLELFDDGTLRLLLMVFVGPEGVMGTYFDSQLEVRSAPVGSVEAEKMLEDGISDLSEALKTGIDVFVEKQPDQQR